MREEKRVTNDDRFEVNFKKKAFCSETLEFHEWFLLKEHRYLTKKKYQ